MNKKDKIIIKGARQNNLKNIDVEIPKNKLVVITGLSGSGKSSLAFDIVYAEGYCRYVENLSAQARFFLNNIKKPAVDSIENLSPSIAIDQKRDSKNPRSTVGTVLGVYDLLRILYAELGTSYCPNCQIPLKKKSTNEILTYIRELPGNTEVYILAPQKITGNLRKQLKNISNQGYAKVRIDDKIFYVDNLLQHNKIPYSKKKGTQEAIEVVVDRFVVNKNRFDQERIIDSLQIAGKLSYQGVVISAEDKKDIIYNKNYHCQKCGFEMNKLKAKNFSFNSPEGACEKCSGLGEIFQADYDKIIPNKKLSINEGGILPWSRLSNSGEGGRRKAILQALAKKYKFSLDKPMAQIAKYKLEKILYGDDYPLKIVVNDKKQEIIFKGVNEELGSKYINKQSTASDLERYLTKKQCPECLGKRLQKRFLTVEVFGKTIGDITTMEINQLVDYLKSLYNNKKFEAYKEKQEVAEKLIQEILLRVRAVQGVGVGYLSLNRAINTLSGGEFQRLRLSTQLQNGLSNLVYVLDEPSVGLHGQDIKNLIQVLRQICQNNNTVIVVEHDRDIIKQADYVIDIGPGAGKNGGKVVFAGTVNQLKKSNTETAKHLFGRQSIEKKESQPAKNKNVRNKLVVKGAQENNLKNIDVEIPLKKLVVVTGVSGGGKSSLIIDVLAKGLRKMINGAMEEPGKHKKIIGAGKLGKVVIVNQSPIGRSPRSNAVTYTGIFKHIRSVFAETEVSKKRQLNDSYFSFNMKGGRCEYCQGEGVQKIEMQLLGGVYTECPHCQGTRYNKKVREIEYQGASIVDVLNMSVDYAYHFFSSKKIIANKLQVLRDVGLGYLKLGQNATELSGGEAQRIKLAAELIKQSSQGAMYILDEPTVGLHFEDINRLLKMLKALVDKGNSIIVVEHNNDVLMSGDWIIELGPKGGSDGGQVVFEGTPNELRKAPTATGKLFDK